MELLTSVLALLVLSRALGSVARKFGQPDVIGEILAGVILGPAMLLLIKPSQQLEGIADLAVFLVIFSAGLEMEIKEVAQAVKGRGLPIAILGFLTPILAGLSFSLLLGISIFQSLFIGLCLSITALPVVLRLISNMKLSGTRIAHLTIGSAILIDLAALFALGVMLDSPELKSFSKIFYSIAFTGSKMAIFFLVTILVYKVLVRNATYFKRSTRVTNKIIKLLGDEGVFGGAVLFVLIFSSISETLGFHFVIGAFFGGLLLSKDFLSPTLFSNIEKTLNSVSSGFLAPIFFAYIGLQFSPQAFEEPLLLVGLIFVGIFSKTFGAWLGGALAGVPQPRGLGIGILLNGRGVMDLVVADIALKHGYINEIIFSGLVLLSILSTAFASLSFSRIAKAELTS